MSEPIWLQLRRRFWTGLAVLLIAAVPVRAEQPISEAEQWLFTAEHLKNAPAGSVLRYAYDRTGRLYPAVTDEVRVRLSPSASGEGKQVHVDYLSTTRGLSLPDIEQARSNPVILFFLERDVREMQKMTGGQAAYFRKRVRLALAEQARVQPVEIEYAGRRISAHEVTVRPFDQDPMRKRFETYADKTYAFILSEEVPGMVYEMRSVMRERRAGDAPDDTVAPLIEERVKFEGTEP
jgi:hypothetical protein